MHMQQAASKLSPFLTQQCLEETVQVLLSLQGAKRSLVCCGGESFLPVNGARLAQLIRTHSPEIKSGRNTTSKRDPGSAACSAFCC